MAGDEQVRELLRAVTPRPEVSIDAEQVRRGARRRRSRAAALSAGMAVVVVGVGLAAVQAIHRPSADRLGPIHVPGELAWQRAPDMPLSPRYDSLTVWTGTEFLVIGGLDRDFTGGPAPFPDLSDGAAYDPASRSWRSIADAPEDLGDYSRGIVVGDLVVVRSIEHWLVYDVGDDTWRQVPMPPVRMPQPMLAADPEKELVYALDARADESDSTVRVLDLRSDTWSALPESPHLPQLNDRSLVMTDVGLVEIGGQVARAQRWDGQAWERYPDSEVTGSGWHWTGSRIISTTNGSEPAGAFDPRSGEWAELPTRPPAGDSPLWTGWPATDGPLVLAEGYLYDDADGSFTAVDAIDGSLSSSGVGLGGGWLVSFGGFHFDPDATPSRVTPVEPTSETWVMKLP